MKAETLEALRPLLNMLRGYSVLEEVRPATFHLDGRDFIHFHDDESSEGVVADVRLSKGRVRMPAANPTEQAELMERIESKLRSLEERPEKASKIRKGKVVSDA